MSSKLLRPLLPLLILAGCQSAAPTPDKPTPDEGVVEGSCCPGATMLVESCADEARCIQFTQHGQPITCLLSIEPEGADEPEPTPQVCDAFLGYQWDGQQCRGARGCSRSAGEWYDAKEVCERAHQHCGPATP
jgi:hypothetical protein